MDILAKVRRKGVIKITKDAHWDDVSCVSYLWPHTARSTEEFEARRAIANLTHGLRRTIGGRLDTPEPTVKDIIRFIEAANAIQEAANVALQEIVAEARSRDITWEQIGKALGAKGRSTPEKRFGRNVKARQSSEHFATASLAGSLMRSWASEASSSNPGFEDDYWDGAPPDVCAQMAFRYIAGACAILGKARHEVRLNNIDTLKFGEQVIRSYEMLVHACSLFTTPEVMSATEAAVAGATRKRAWIDESAGTYLTRTVCLAQIALQHFEVFVNWVRNDSPTIDEAAIQSLGVAQRLLNSSMESLTRPECLEAIIKMEIKISERGDAVYYGRRPEWFRDTHQRQPDGEEVFFKHWRSNEYFAPDDPIDG